MLLSPLAMYKFLTTSFVLLSFALKAQFNDSLIHALLLNIASLQVQTKGKDFYAGMFPSYRECAGAPHNYVPDNNIFYTAVAAFTLQNLLPYLNEDDKAIAENIVTNIQKIYPLFRNKHNYPYYGFWATEDPIMPHSYFYKYLKQIFGQGEDADDTSIIFLTDSSLNKDISLYKKRLEDVANLSSSKRRITSTYSKYKNIPAYSTYLGSRTIPDFDFAVQCNILYFVLSKHLPFVKQDSATLRLVINMVRNREYMKAPVYISPYYVRSSILIYHVVRLMSAFKIPELNEYRQQLVEDAKNVFYSSNNAMDKILMSTVLMKLDIHDLKFASPFISIQEFENSNQQQFVFFQARAAYSYRTPLKQMMLHFSYINYYFYCPAYYKILWLENLVLTSKQFLN